MPSASPRRASGSLAAIRKTATLSTEITTSPTGSSASTLGRASATEGEVQTRREPTVAERITYASTGLVMKHGSCRASQNPRHLFRRPSAVITPAR